MQAERRVQRSEESLLHEVLCEYVDWDAASVVPLKVYIFDVTDPWRRKPGNRDSIGKTSMPGESSFLFHNVLLFSLSKFMIPLA